jgi:hypothetical protein
MGDADKNAMLKKSYPQADIVVKKVIHRSK